MLPVLVAAQPTEAEGKAILDMLGTLLRPAVPATCLSTVRVLQSYTDEVGSLIGTGRAGGIPLTILLPKPSNPKGWQTLMGRCLTASPSPPRDGDWLTWIRTTAERVTEGQGLATGMLRKRWQEFKHPSLALAPPAPAPEVTPEPEVQPRHFPRGASLDI